MRGTVNIGGMPVEMFANAASPFIYRRIFKKDFLLEMDKGDGGTNTNAMSEMAFVMYLQAHRDFKDIVDTTTEDDFWEWITQFEAFDLPMAANEVLRLFQGQEKTLVNQKKSRRRRRGNKQQRS